jgi:hypothetical protein
VITAAAPLLGRPGSGQQRGHAALFTCFHCYHHRRTSSGKSNYGRVKADHPLVVSFVSENVASSPPDGLGQPRTPRGHRRTCLLHALQGILRQGAFFVRATRPPKPINPHLRTKLTVGGRPHRLRRRGGAHHPQRRLRVDDDWASNQAPTAAPNEWTRSAGGGFTCASLVARSDGTTPWARRYLMGFLVGTRVYDKEAKPTASRVAVFNPSPSLQSDLPGASSRKLSFLGPL